jgi:RimJ/RimL family protein N-acetyltransferase
MRYQSTGARTLAESRAYLERGQALIAAVPRSVFDFAVCLDGQLVGRVGLGCDDGQSPKTARVWYVLHPSHRGQGLAHEAVRALLDFAFGTLALHRVSAEVDPRNGPSLRVAERLGMRKEAHHLENEWLQGEWVDTVVFAVLAREWRGQPERHLARQRAR